jgi:hypothetical protein
MNPIIKNLKKSWDQMTDEEQEKVQMYVNELEQMTGRQIIVKNPNGDIIEVI